MRPILVNLYSSLAGFWLMLTPGFEFMVVLIEWIMPFSSKLFVSTDTAEKFSSFLLLIKPSNFFTIFILFLESLCVLLIILYRTLFSDSEIGKRLTLCNMVMNSFTLHL